jgi:hypothetical protein
MAFSPVLTFDLAGPVTDPVAFTVDASAIGAIPDAATVDYQPLLTGLANAIRTPADANDAANLGTFALMVLFAQPLHGGEVRASFAQALRTFDAITVAVLIGDDGIAFSIGNTGDTGDLRCRLANLEGGSESGQVGQWPRAQAAH